MRYVVELSYICSEKFAGWQIQKNKLSYQQLFESAFEKVLNVKINLQASGRTDSGVSAIKQVAHFDYDQLLPKNFVGHINSILPEEARVLNVYTADSDFHARFSAKCKTYKYYFYVSKINIPYFDTFAHQVKTVIDDKVLTKQVKNLVGSHNFKSFCASGSSVTDFTRTIYSADIEKKNQLYEFTICGNGFLYNMVRIIVGTLIDIASGKLNYNINKIISLENREFAGKTAPAKGLVLFDVNY